MINETLHQPTQAGVWTYVAEIRPQIENALLRHLPTSFLPAETRFDEALGYAMFPGGKRLRPVLTMLGAEVVGGSGLNVLGAAAAVEYLHNSSLIFDDLPCMDNAKERRGKPALHVGYGEGLAVLIALALLNASYGLVINVSQTEKEFSAIAHGEIVNCVEGQIRGQAVDIAEGSEQGIFSKQGNFEALRNLKATALIRLALRLGAIFSGASQRHLDALSAFADLLGDAYQISDDIADVIEDEALLDNGRQTTFPVASGKESAKSRVISLSEEAKGIIKSEFGSGGPAGLLCDIADYVASRSA